MTDAPRTLRDGRYRVLRVLGAGSQATTFDAVNVKTGQRVAVKRFRVHGARSWKDVELAEREARVLAGLSHPLLPRYVEHFEEGGELFLVTEKIRGWNLASLRKRGMSFDEGSVVRLLQDAAEVLDYLHGRAPPIVHRDIKPANVLLTRDGSFAFIDFGAVRDRMKPEGGSTVVGTFGYMAPEQFQGRAMPASDVYAVGATALALLTGREPEDLPHDGLGLDVPKALARHHVSPELVSALSAMLEPNPDDRADAIGPLLEDLVPSEEEPEEEEQQTEAIEIDANEKRLRGCTVELVLLILGSGFWGAHAPTLMTLCFLGTLAVLYVKWSQRRSSKSRRLAHETREEHDDGREERRDVDAPVAVARERAARRLVRIQPVDTEVDADAVSEDDEAEDGARGARRTRRR